MSLNRMIIDWYIFCSFIGWMYKNTLFSHYYLHRPLCKDQAFRSERKTDREKEKNFSQDGKFESVLQWVVCLPCGTGTAKGKLRNSLCYFCLPFIPHYFSSRINVSVFNVDHLHFKRRPELNIHTGLVWIQYGASLIFYCKNMYWRVDNCYLHFAIDGVLRSFGWVSRLSPMEVNFPKIVRMGMSLSTEWTITNWRILPFPHLSSMEMKVTISVDIPNHWKWRIAIIKW